MENESLRVLGFVPSKRIMGFAMLEDTDLTYRGVKSLKRYKDDGEKIRVANDLLRSVIMYYQPDVIIALALTGLKMTVFNSVLTSSLEKIAKPYACPVYSLTGMQVKETILKNQKPKNYRQLAKALGENYPELGYYLPSESTNIIREREKYYQPMFIAVGLARSYLKIIKRNDQTSLIKNDQTRLS